MVAQNLRSILISIRNMQVLPVWLNIMPIYVWLNSIKPSWQIPHK